ncbi:integumentary mucin C.1-like [Anoplophora glabripennis]|uniref:integumentary mucin C.1-like n=1 Tax=Anoplophora glabripennis TaxID=217634 RepID=UPI0008753A57|nr:integumentary mucin C.1-like [Anoplophora glabripennis]
MKIFLVFQVVIISTVSLYQVNGCGTNNVECLTDTTYQFCFIVDSQVTYVDGVMTCATGTTCNENGTYVCMDSSSTDSTSTTTTSATTTTTTATTTDATTTTTTATGPPETCTEAGKYPADACDQYWECLAVMWWYELVLQSCGTDLSYNSTSQECVANGTCSTTTTTTETTTVTTTATPATGPPETCTETGKYPADACDQYWECLAVMWWYELVLQSCGTDLSYNSTSQECVANGTCSTTTTTTETTTVTTTATPATGPPDTCTETGTYTADACNQYWECVAVMWWYELVLQTCGTDQAYNATSQACGANSTCIL